MHERRTVRTAAHVVLARPDRLDRPPGGLGHLYRFAHEIRHGVRAAAESSPQELGVNLHLLRFETGDLRGDLLIDRLELSAGRDSHCCLIWMVQVEGLHGACATGTADRVDRW